jgi:hypothetical protein
MIIVTGTKTIKQSKKALFKYTPHKWNYYAPCAYDTKVSKTEVIP